VQGDEEHRVVVSEDRIGAVAVVDVPVDDRDTSTSASRRCAARAATATLLNTQKPIARSARA
jgi:hypothetical protein